MAAAIATAAMALAMAAAAGLLATTASELPLANGLVLAETVEGTVRMALSMMAAATAMSVTAAAMATIDMLAGTAPSDFTHSLQAETPEPIKLQVVRAYRPARIEPDIIVQSIALPPDRTPATLGTKAVKATVRSAAAPCSPTAL